MLKQGVLATVLVIVALAPFSNTTETAIRSSRDPSRVDSEILRDYRVLGDTGGFSATLREISSRCDAISLTPAECIATAAGTVAQMMRESAVVSTSMTRLHTGMGPMPRPTELAEER